MAREFEDGAEVWVKVSARRRLPAIVLASSNASTREHDYNIFKLRVFYAGLDGVRSYITPKPVQGYKLSRRKTPLDQCFASPTS